MSHYGKYLFKVLGLAALGAALLLPAQAQRLSIISWNLESGESSDAFIANRVKTFQAIDIWGLSEVAGQATVTAFEPAAEEGEGQDVFGAGQRGLGLHRRGTFSGSISYSDSHFYTSVSHVGFI